MWGEHSCPLALTLVFAVGFCSRRSSALWENPVSTPAPSTEADRSVRPTRQNSKYPPPEATRGLSSLSPGGSRPTIPRNDSHAASFNAGSAPTSSRIIFQAAMLSAPSGGGPMARETEHCGQKQIRCAADFCRGLIPTVWANMYTATDLCPASSSRLQRRQNRLSKGSRPGSWCQPNQNSVAALGNAQVRRKIPAKWAVASTARQATCWDFCVSAAALHAESFVPGRAGTKLYSSQKPTASCTLLL